MNIKNKKLLYIYIGTNVIFFISSLFLMYTILLLNGVENILRYIFIIIYFLINLLFFKKLMTYLFNNKVKKKIKIWTVILLIITVINIFLGYNINRFYTSINKINKSKVTYSTSLIALTSNNYNKASDVNNQKIGIIKDKESIDGYKISQDIINKNKLKTELTEYETTLDLLNALYNKEVNAIFISSNYITLYGNLEKFHNLSSETTVITSLEKQYDKENTIIKNTNNNSITKPFTVLIMGVDSEKEDIYSNNAFNGDSLMLITFNPKTLNATILSIPRDTYVPIACFRNNKKNKITHAAWYGEQCMIKTISDFTGINIDYYVKINFKGVVNLVDKFGGIEVDVPIEFCEQDSNRWFGKHEICLKPGVQALNGEQALALARHRKTINDIQRGFNQQLVIKGLMNKASNITSINQLQEILDTLAINMDTNMTTNEILSFYNVGKDILLKTLNKSDEIIKLERLYLSGYDKMIWEDEMKLTLYNYVYYKESLDEIIKAMKINLELEEVEISKSFSYLVNETYTEKIIGKGYYNSKDYYPTVPSFIGQTKDYVLSWAKNNSFKINIEEVESTSTPGLVLDQNLPRGYLFSSLSTKELTIEVAIKPKEVPKDKDDNNKDDDSTEKDDTKIEKDDNKEEETEEKITVPNMIGWTEAEVKTWDNKYGSKLIVSIVKKEITSDDDKTKLNKVISNTKTGAVLDDIAEITVTILIEKKETNTLED